MTWNTWKRPVEASACALGLILLSPLLILVALAVKLGDLGPVFYNSTRVGLDGEAFTMFKFRSMVQNADRFLDADGNPTRDRLTRVGKILRRLSLDELPQLANVVKGDMALVGPRPVPPEYAEMMSEQQRRRHEVRPGLTGLAQVETRHSSRWSERVAMDIEYVDGLSLRMDARIILRTARAIIGPDVLLDRGSSSSKIDLG